MRVSENCKTNWGPCHFCFGPDQLLYISNRVWWTQSFCFTKLPSDFLISLIIGVIQELQEPLDSLDSPKVSSFQRPFRPQFFDSSSSNLQVRFFFSILKLWIRFKGIICFQFLLYLQDKKGFASRNRWIDLYFWSRSFPPNLRLF